MLCELLLAAPRRRRRHSREWQVPQQDWVLCVCLCVHTRALFEFRVVVVVQLGVLFSVRLEAERRQLGDVHHSVAFRKRYIRHGIVYGYNSEEHCAGTRHSNEHENLLNKMAKNSYEEKHGGK